MRALRACSAVLLLRLLLRLRLLALGAGVGVLEYHRIAFHTTSPGEIEPGV
jgi:hypothetical protein